MKSMPQTANLKPFIDNHLVKFKDKLNQVVWMNLNSEECRMLNIILSDYYYALQRNPRVDMIEISYSDLRKRMNYTSNHQSLSAYMNELKSDLLGWREIKTKNTVTDFVLLTTLQNDKKNKVFRFALNPNLVSLLLFDPKQGNYIAYQEGIIINLQRTASMHTVRLLKQVRTTGWLKIPKRNTEINGKIRLGLWEQLEVNLKERETDFAREMRNILMDIAPYFGHLSFEKIYGVVRGHRTVKGYSFTFDKEPYDIRKLPKPGTPEAKKQGLINIWSAKCLTKKQKCTAIDKFLKQKRGTAWKKLKQKNKSQRLSLFDADTGTAKINLKFCSKNIAKKAKNADKKQLQNMAKKLAAKSKRTPAQTNDLMLLKQIIAGR